MHEPPVSTTATVLAPRGANVVVASLPNGKPVVCHLPKALLHLAPALRPGTRLQVELTPYDFDHARIAGVIPQADQK